LPVDFGPFAGFDDVLLVSSCAEKPSMRTTDGPTVLAAMAEGDTLRTLTAALRRFLKAEPVNVVALRRQIADAVAARSGYPF
jgi:hypothetical protein